MTIKDRGNIKWASLMLVEHREKLKKLKESESNKKKPELREDELQRMDYLLKKALREKLTIKVSYYHKKNFHQWRGKIKKLRSVTRQIILSNGENATEGEKIKIELKDIVDIELLNC